MNLSLSYVCKYVAQAVIQLSSIIGSLSPSAASTAYTTSRCVFHAAYCLTEMAYIILDYPPQTKRLIFARFFIYLLLDQFYISNLFKHKRRCKLIATPKPQYLIQQVFLLPNHKVNNFHFYFGPQRDRGTTETDAQSINTKKLRKLRNIQIN